MNSIHYDKMFESGGSTPVRATGIVVKEESVTDTDSPVPIDRDELLKRLKGRWDKALVKLGVFKKLSYQGNEWIACRSPLRGDGNPSFSVNKNHGGYHDHGTEESGDGIDLVKAAMQVDFKQALQKLDAVATALETGMGLTVNEYAQAKHLSASTLKEVFGLRDGVYQGLPCVEIPYHDEQAVEVAKRLRLSLEGANRFRWAKGAKAGELVYGLEVMANFTGEMLWVMEGESNLHAARQHQLPGLSIPGKGLAHAALVDAIVRQKTLRTVIVLLDPDATNLAAALKEQFDQRGWTGELKSVVVQQVCGVKDLCDLHAQKTSSEFEAEMQKLLEAAQPVTVAAPPVERKKVQVGNRSLHELADEVIGELLTHNTPPVIFQQDGRLVRIRTSHGQAGVETLGEDSLRHRMSEVCGFVKKGSGGEATQVFPPMDVVKNIQARSTWHVPTLKGVVNIPVFGKTGTLIQKPGYDADSGLWYEPNHGALPTIPTHPTEGQIQSARDLLLKDLLVDFPFDSRSSKAHAVAAALVPLVRSMIDGPTPLHVIEAPTAGTGKGLLADVIGLPILGQSPQAMTEAKDDEEWRKRIISALSTGRPLFYIDNINRSLRSAALASALTAEVFQDRELGQSKIISAPVRCLWLATGNNLSMSNEINRRVVLCRIDAKQDQPYLRRGFKHADLRGWTRTNREKLMVAYLTLVQGWVDRGQPAGKLSMGSYESYARVIGGILQVAGIEGFLENLQDSYLQGNDEANEWRAFIQAWWDDFHQCEVGVGDLFASLLGEKSMLLGGILGDRDPARKKIRLGKELQRKRDNVIAGYRLTMKDGFDRNGSRIYVLVPQPTEPVTLPQVEKTLANPPSPGSLEGSSAGGGGVKDAPPADSPHDPPQGKCCKTRGLDSFAGSAGGVLRSECIQYSPSSLPSYVGSVATPNDSPHPPHFLESSHNHRENEGFSLRGVVRGVESDSPHPPQPPADLGASTIPTFDPMLDYTRQGTGGSKGERNALHRRGWNNRRH